MPQALRNRAAVPAPLQPHGYDCAQRWDCDCDCDHAQPHGYDCARHHDCGCDACAAAAGDVAAAAEETTSAAVHVALSRWPLVVR